MKKALRHEEILGIFHDEKTESEHVEWVVQKDLEISDVNSSLGSRKNSD